MRTFSLLALFTGCSGPAAEPSDAGFVEEEEPCTMVATLGHEGAGRDFVPYAEGDPAEIVLGYQGFRFIQVVLRTEGIEDARLLASFTIEVAGQAPYPQVSWIDVASADDGIAYSPVFLVYFNDITYSDIIDRDCTLGVSVAHRRCPDTTSVRVHLVDEDPCIHVPGGEDDAGACVDRDGGVE